MDEHERFEHDARERKRDLLRDKDRKKKSNIFWTIVFLFISIITIYLLLRACDIVGPDRNKIDRDGDTLMDRDPAEIHNFWHGSSGEDMLKGDLGVEKQWSEGYQALSLAPKKVIPNPSITPINGSLSNNVIEYSKYFLGTPYEYGSDRSNAKTFDCSDFTRWVYLGSLGMDIPKDSRSQAVYVKSYGKRKYNDIRQAQVGDLLFFGSYRGYKQADYAGVDRLHQKITHVGIYLGNGRMIHTASRPLGVRIQPNIFNNQYSWRFVAGGTPLNK
jgi:peptidoglycan DL-endopeptidase CwlO